MIIKLKVFLCVQTCTCFFCCCSLFPLPNTVAYGQMDLTSLPVQKCLNPCVPKQVERKPWKEKDRARGNPTELQWVADFTEKVCPCLLSPSPGKAGMGAELGRSPFPLCSQEEGLHLHPAYRGSSEPADYHHTLPHKHTGFNLP